MATRAIPRIHANDQQRFDRSFDPVKIYSETIETRVEPAKCGNPCVDVDNRYRQFGPLGIFVFPR